MANVYCTIREVVIDNVPSVVAICGRCDHSCTAFGRHEGSIKRALATLREECPQGEDNFYEASEVERSERAAPRVPAAPPDKPRILICTAMRETHLEPEVAQTIERYMKRPAEIIPSSTLNWNLLRSNEGGWDGAYRFVAARYQIFCLVPHSETGGLSRGVYTLAKFAFQAGQGVVQWRPGGTLQRVTAVKETGYNDWKRDYGMAVTEGVAQ